MRILGIMKVFVVEDSPAVCERLIEMIEATGAHAVVGQAANHEDAVRRIEATQPDVGIFDVTLARGNGIEALAAARALVPSLVGIVITNFATQQHLSASTAAGARYFLDKSADFERIPEILSSLSGNDADKEST